jgi:hypothetical protein
MKARRNKKNKIMKNTLITILIAITAFVSPVFGGEKVVVTAPVQESVLDTTVKLFAASVIEDKDTYAFGGGISLEVPVFENFKLEAVGSVYEDEVYALGANALLYFPVSQNLSLYTLGGGGYDFETEQWFVGAGAGVKYSLSPQLSLFTDGVYNFTPENDLEDGVVTVRLGVGFSF